MLSTDKKERNMNIKWILDRCVAAIGGALLLVVAPSVSDAMDAVTKKITTDAQQFSADKPIPLQPIFNALYVEGEHNAVLNFNYLGLAALEVGEYAVAEKAFDAAIERIEAIYADNPNAKKAKSVFSAEKVKDFKGEPYERAMTYYYRGVLYLRVGDYQNARASFLSAERQSALAENEAYDSTFGLMDYLAGWSSFCDGDVTRAQELKERAAKAQPEIFASLRPDVSYIGLIDVGTGPVKFGTGQYKEKLSFKPSDESPAIVSVSANAATVSDPILAGDLNWQAATRGGRPVDAILNGKAQWKSGTDAASSALTAVGYASTVQGVISANQNLQNAGTIGMALGLFGSLVSKAMTPAADTREWVSLPAAIEMDPGQTRGDEVPTLNFVALTPGSSGSTALNARVGKCAVSWGRTESSLSSAAAQLRAPVPLEAKREVANAQFRSFLTSTFAAPASPATTASN
jgi:tetratricopeptide (TPR) repeat protein